MNPIEKNARAVLAKLHDWRHETFVVDGNTLLGATKFTPTEINDAVAYLKRLGAVETIEFIGTHPYCFGEVSITSHGEYLYQERAGDAQTQTSAGKQVVNAECDYDCFVSHASEDKGRFVDALAHGLREAGCTVWYDDFVLKVGDSLRRKIDEGLLKSRHGVVVLSPAFFKKDWPQKELDGLAALARERGILPVWLDVTKEDIVRFSPTLADIVAARASSGVETVVRKLLDSMGSITPDDKVPSEDGDARSISESTERENERLAVAAKGGQQILTDGADISWDLSDGGCATVTLQGNRALDNPTNQKAGSMYQLTVKQDATGSRTLKWGANYRFPGAVSPTLSATANAEDMFLFVSDGTHMGCIGATFDVK